MDGRVDPARIAAVARDLADPDVCCFQEVAINFAVLAGSAGENQVTLLGAEFRGYSAHFACAVDVPDGSGGRRRYGNLILSRLPARQVLRHSLPWPADAAVPNMPRVALEAVVQAPWGLVSVLTTHLEYYSARQRTAQVERLCELRAEAIAHSRAPSKDKGDGGVFTPYARPLSSILTGDFNMRPDDPLVARLEQDWDDAWKRAHPGVAHPPTFFLHDRSAPSAPYCSDYVFLSRDLVPRLAAVRVDAQTLASDHQPVIVELRP